MGLRFTIQDFTSGSQVDTIVDEPVGWDSITLNLKRDDLTHGFFGYIDDSVGQMDFYGPGYQVLSAAYNTYGIKAVVHLLVEFACSDTDSYETLYASEFIFSDYREATGAHGCHCAVLSSAVSCLDTWRNRNETDVNLDSLKSFDSDTDNLTSYTGIGTAVHLNAKPITFYNDWEMNLGDSGHQIREYDDTAAPSTVGSRFLAFNLDWDKQNISEIITSDPTPYYYDVITPTHPFTSMADIYQGMIIFDRVSKLDCTEEYEVTIDLEGTIEFQTVHSITFSAGQAFIRYGSDAQIASQTETYISIGSNTTHSGSGTVTVSYSIHETHTVTLNQGDRLFFYINITNFQYLSFSGTAGAHIVTNWTEGKLKVAGTSLCSDTDAKGYMVNEVLSRISEATTNDCLRVYSDYFGRTNAQPYPSLTDGCGALEVLTNGLLIRNSILSDGTNPALTTNFKKVFSDLAAIHNIGAGIEDDPNRAGYQLIRVEPVGYFYNSSVVFTAEEVEEILRDTVSKGFITTFETGYAKWEAERINGSDEFLTGRKYRTSITQARNTLTQKSAFIASGYAWEVTRREFGGSTSDWRYDNDTFILCVEYLFDTAQLGVTIVGDGVDTIYVMYGGSGYSVAPAVTITGLGTGATAHAVLTGDVVTSIVVDNPGTGYFAFSTFADAADPTTATRYKSEVTNVGSPANILNSSAIYNYRISPIRNAMRWLKTIYSAFRDWASESLIFTSGDGNITAQGVNTVDCIIESGVLKENQDVDTSDFADPTDADPIYTSEIATFTYPMSYEEFKAVAANPYGTVKYNTNGGAWLYGYIQQMKYSPYKGLAEFILKPKI